MGILLSILASAAFAVSSVAVRVGMRSSPRDDGLFMTIFVNFVVLGVAGLVVAKPAWSTRGVATLAAAGLIGSVAGRFAGLRAIRLVGPTRSSVFITGMPLVAAVAGWILLGETVGLVDAAGGVLVVAGLAMLAVTRSRAAPVPGSEAHVRPTFIGYLYASASPVAVGLAFVVRKWGLRSYDSAVLGAFLGAAAAFCFFLVFDLARGNFRARVAANFRHVNWWFVAAGTAISLALIAQFTAFSYVAAWIVGALQGTQPLWVTVIGYAFLRTEERIDSVVVASVLVVAAGVALISLVA